MRFKLCFLILSFLACNSAYGINTYTGLWGSFVVMGPTRYAQDIKYYYDGQIKFIDDQYKFQNAYLSLGIGKQLNEHWLLLLANTFIVNEPVNSNDIDYVYMIWEEANWHQEVFGNNSLSFRTRLQEELLFGQSAISLVFRERVMYRIPIAKLPGFSYVFYDEGFFNLNRPDWVTNSFFAQNRAFIGIGKIIAKRVTIDIGYLNRLIFGTPVQMTNILSISVNITGKEHYYKD